MEISETRSAVAATAMLLAALPGYGAVTGTPPVREPKGYTVLVKLFEDWRNFERPTMRNNVPDYGHAGVAAKVSALPAWRKKLDDIDTNDWPVTQLNDYKLVKAEMNGLGFNLRVLRPWARDPAFYVNVWSSRTDVPVREAPVVYPEIELYNYRY